MPKTTSLNSKYSIYKIDLEAVIKEYDIKDDITKGDTLKIVDLIINEIVKSVKRKKFSDVHRVKYNGMYGLFFKTVHEPAWLGIARVMIEQNEYDEEQHSPKSDFLKNTNISYVLFYMYEDSIYAVTGGYGNLYINKIIKKNYGLNLIPKLVDRNNPVIKSIIQNNLLGNQTATQKTNKQSTSISIEQDMSSIFRQLNIQLDKDTAEEIGIAFNEKESDSKKIGIENKDSIVIRRSISLPELKAIIGKLNEFEKIEAPFALNYLSPVEKIRISSKDLNTELIAAIIGGDENNFIITGDDYTSYFIEADKYILKNEKGDTIISSLTPIEFVDIIKEIEPKHLNKSYVEKVLKKWTISTYDNDGNKIIYDEKIINVIQGFIESEVAKRPCYLFNGEWYSFDDTFSKNLNKEFENYYNQTITCANNLLNTFELLIKEDTEEEYNEKLFNNKKIIGAHTVLKENIEIADAIFWDEENIYFMHNKGSFNGSGSRDVYNQVLTSAEFFQQKRNIENNKEFFEEYYNSISNKYKREKLELSISKDDFLDNMKSTKKIIYVVGYINDYKKNSKSNYAKYLTIESNKILEKKGFKLYVVGIN